jgi:hypothetical protein
VRSALTVALIAALLSCLWYAHRTGYKAGTAAVEARWGAARVEAEKAFTAALLASQQAYERDMVRRDGVERGLQAKLAGSDARADGLARRLRYALGSACPVSQTDTPAPVPDGAAGVTGNAGAVGEALTAHLAACERDATRFAELQNYLTP